MMLVSAISASKCHDEFKNLHLPANNITDEAVKYIATFPSLVKYLEKLDLAKNRIGEVRGWHRVLSAGTEMRLGERRKVRCLGCGAR